MVTDVSWLATGPRVLKANHSVQGESVWLCKRSEEAGTEGQIVVQHAQDGSVITTDAEKFVDGTLAALFRGTNSFQDSCVCCALVGVASHASQLTTVVSIDAPTIAASESSKSMVSAWTADEPHTCYLVDQPFLREVEEKGELLVTMVGPTPVALQRRVPAPGKFSATFKAGAKFEKCNLADDAWTDMRSSLADATTTHRPTTLMEAAGCSTGSSPCCPFFGCIPALDACTRVYLAVFTEPVRERED